MKHIVLVITTLLITFGAFAQTDVTKFLGIPVDGSKSDMIKKLKDKGFRANPYDKDVLEGVFNGTDVNVSVVTNGDKVYRIAVIDANGVDERSIQIRFNNLCYQFKNNPNYDTYSGDYEIPDDEDISYEISVHKKRYEAVFYQKPEAVTDSAAIEERLKPIFSSISSRFTTEQLQSPTEDEQNQMQKMVIEYVLEFLSKKTVWFMISEMFGEYYIAMYYDNVYNQAHGEDL